MPRDGRLCLLSSQTTITLLAMLPSSQQQFIANSSNPMNMFSGALQTNYTFNGVPNLPPLDQNSPELFKQNLAHAHREVLRLQSLARDALSGM